MKLTKSRLRHLIKEELHKTLKETSWRPKQPSAEERRSAKGYVIQNSDGSFVEDAEGVVFYEDEGEAIESLVAEQEVKYAYLSRDIPRKGAWIDWRIPKGDATAKWKVGLIPKQFETSTELPPPPRQGRSKRHAQYRKMGFDK